MLNERNYLPFLGWLLLGLVGSLLSQTFLLPYIIGSGALAIIANFFISPEKRSKLSQLSLPSFGFLLVAVAGLIGNLVTSQNKSTTIESVVTWLFVILIWWLARISRVKPPGKGLIWLGGLVLALTVGVISISTWLIPSLRLLPPMNFLYATYGHNHFNVWLLISLPFIGFASQIWPSNWWRWIVGGCLIWIFSTFGRWGVAIFFLELLVMWWRLRFDKNWDVWLKGLFGLCLGGLIFWTAWSGQMAKLTSRADSLDSDFYKPIKFEQRPEYWYQSVQGILKEPVWGYGLDNFRIISFLERRSPDGFSNYAHNDYLQLIAETGWFGWFISLALGWIWWRNRPAVLGAKALPKTSGSKTSIDIWFWRALWIATGAILVNSWLDFDLHFVAVQVFMALGLGWLQRSAEKNQLKLTKNKPQNISQKFRIISRKIQLWLMAGLTLICLSWAVYFGLINYWWQHDRRQLVWQQPFYFSSYEYLLMADYKFAPLEQQQKILPQWFRQVFLLTDLLTKYSDYISPDQKILAMEALYKINPWSRVEHDLIGAYIKEKDWVAAQRTLEKSDLFFQTSIQRDKIDLAVPGGNISKLMARQAIYLAGMAFTNSNDALGWKNLNLARKYEPWAFGTNLADFNFPAEMSPAEQTRYDRVKGRAMRFTQMLDWETSTLYDFIFD